MKTRLSTAIAIGSTALILLTGCVSSKKYKGSQADLARVRNDSARLAQQVSSLNGNVQDLQSKNTTLQRSLDSSSNSYASQQKNLDYYQGYFKDQQNSMSQVSDSVKSALTQAGISNADVRQEGNIVYVRLNENDLFRKNSTAVTSGGKQVLNNLAEVVKDRSNTNVFVGVDDSASGIGGSNGNMSGMENNNNNNMSSEGYATHRPRHHQTMHARSGQTSGTASSSKNGGSSSSGGSVAANSSTNGGQNSTSPAHKKVHHHYSSEGSMAYYNTSGNMYNHGLGLRRARMVTVANHFLQSGVPKIHVTLEKSGMNARTPGNTIKVTITPKMEDFNPQTGSSALR